MGIYLRKSIKVGHLRFNLSGSGIGVSAGVKGLRFGVGPHGNYVHMGQGGLYYRSAITQSPTKNIEKLPPSQRQGALFPNSALEEIESADISQIVDSSSQDILNELNQKRTIALIWPFVLGAAALFTLTGMYLGWPVWLFASSILFSVISVFVAYSRDQLTKTTVLLYDLETETENALVQLHASLEEIASCPAIWHIESVAKIEDPKHHAGAAYSTNRTQTSIQKLTPPFIKTNVEIFAVVVGRQTIYFFPDRVLIYDKEGIGGLQYKNFLVQVSREEFIERGTLPVDALEFGHTWEYVNKSGGPDKRFKNNKEIPICLYSKVSFSSENGFNEVLLLSKAFVGEKFANAVEALGHKIPKENVRPNSVTSKVAPSPVPSGSPKNLQYKQIVNESLSKVRPRIEPDPAPLLSAAIIKDVAATEKFIRRGDLINQQSKEGITALMAAAGVNANDVLMSLLANGADPNLEDTDGMIALSYALVCESIKCARLLVDAGSRLDVVDPKLGLSVLHLAASTNDAEFVEILVKKGVDVNASAKSGITPLMLAANNKSDSTQTAVVQSHKRVDEILLDNGADLHLLSENGLTALAIAAQSGNEDSCKFLLARGANINTKSIDGSTVIQIAARNGHAGVVALLNRHITIAEGQSEAGGRSIVSADVKVVTRHPGKTVDVGTIEAQVIAPKTPDLGFDDFSAMASNFLKEIEKKVCQRLPFSGEHGIYINEEDQSVSLCCSVTPKYYYSLGVRYQSSSASQLFLGYYSDNKKRDPAFKKQVANILGETKTKTVLEGLEFSFVSGRYLALEAIEQIDLSMLMLPSTVDLWASKFLEVMNNTWRLLWKN